MSTKLVAFAFGCVMMLSCRKDRAPSSFTVQVTDCVTGQPIERAEIVHFDESDFDLTCLCFLNRTEITMGFTDNLGMASGLSSVDHLSIRKPGYYTGEFSVWGFNFFERRVEGTTANYRLFKTGQFEITADPTQLNYSPEPIIRVFPVLPDGSTPWYGIDLPAFAMAPYILPGAGDITNRICVLQNNSSGGMDTLYKNDIFLPAGTTKPVTVTY